MQNTDDGKIIISAIVDDKNFLKKIKQIENTKVRDIEISPEIDVETLKKEMAKAIAEISKYKQVDVINQEELTQIQEYTQFLEKANDRLEELTGHKMNIPGLEEVTKNVSNISKQDLKDIQKQIGGLGTGIEKATKKIAKMALAVFGIRSAFMFVRNSINAITQQDEQLKANIDYMKNAIAYTIEPIVRRIVDWAYQILQYVRYIIKSWFNYDIFGNANKNLKNTNKSAKELKRTLASFDEVNILSSGNTSGTGNVAPNIDLQADIQPPKWVQWIADNKELILTFGVALGTVFGASAIGKILGNIGKLFGTASGTGLVGLAKILGVIGTVWIATIAVKGVAEAITQITLFKDAWNDTKSAMDGVSKKEDELIKKVTEDFENLPQESVDQFFGYLDNEINSAKSQIENLSKQKDNLWWSWTEQRKVEEQIDEYKQKLIKLTNTKYQLKIKTAIDATNLTDFLNELKGVGLLKIAANLPTILNKYKSFGMAKGGVSYPRLAKGAIANLPGKGIPTTLGGGKWAEAGMEGYLPLTDSQVMSMLGAEIGKNVVINLTNVTELDGRTISRKVQEIGNSTNFLMNR